jgi:hypothetical protein
MLQSVTLFRVGLFYLSTGTAGDYRSKCEELWLERNAYFANAGYCFKTAPAIRTFGNADCAYDNERDVPLSETIRARINEILRIERAICR